MINNEQNLNPVDKYSNELLCNICLKMTALFLKEQEISNLISGYTFLDFERFDEVKKRHEQNIALFFSATDLNMYSNNSNYDNLNLYTKAITEHISYSIKVKLIEVEDFNSKLTNYFEELNQVLNWYKCLI